jgi:hypothetical protein
VNRHPPIVNEDVNYLIEDNTMDDVCLSPELDGTLGMPAFEHSGETSKLMRRANSGKMAQR